MAILSELLEKRNNGPEKPVVQNEECAKIIELKDKLAVLLDQSHYVARSEYLSWKPDFEKTAEYFTVLWDSGMLDAFASRTGYQKQI